MVRLSASRLFAIAYRITRTPCAGDSIPVDHVLQLTFDHRVDPTTIKTALLADHQE